jgi:hypothetical protein
MGLKRSVHGLAALVLLQWISSRASICKDVRGICGWIEAALWRAMTKAGLHLHMIINERQATQADMALACLQLDMPAHVTLD